MAKRSCTVVTLEVLLSRTALSPATGCRVWLRGTDVSGYGIIRFRGRRTAAHRVAWMLAHGPIPDGMQACHHCDNPPCVNPDHLFLGTHKDNADDRDSKGRHYCVTGREHVLRGERHGCAKLTAAQIVQIRDARRAGRLHREIAKEYGVARTTVTAILRGEHWASVPQEPA